jgi:lipopolysaccharide biosynthesis glycosyltransferase
MFLHYKLIIFITLLLFYLLIIKQKNKSIDNSELFNEFGDLEENVNQTIIIENKYESFEKMKLNYNNDPIYKPFLEQIKIIAHVYNNNYQKIKVHKNMIHICVALNNEYIYPLLVSIESVLMNCNKKKSFYIYHILCYPDFTEKNLAILKSLVNKYPFNVEMIFYNMGNSFMNRETGRYSQATYYKILSPIFIDLDRIIYLDGDTLTFKDINEMYQLDFNDNYVLGAYDFYSNGLDYLGIKSNIFINGGVLLFNLEKIRKNKMHEMLNIINNSSIRLEGNDQTLINYVFYPDIGRIPSKYITFNFHDESDIEVYLKIIRTKLDFNELKESFKDPIIMHSVLCFPKLWTNNPSYAVCCTACKKRNDCNCEKYHKLWYSFANKTDYYKEIVEHYRNSY